MLRDEKIFSVVYFYFYFPFKRAEKTKMERQGAVVVKDFVLTKRGNPLNPRNQGPTLTFHPQKLFGISLIVLRITSSFQYLVFARDLVSTSLHLYGPFCHMFLSVPSFIFELSQWKILMFPTPVVFAVDLLAIFVGGVALHMQQQHRHSCR